LSCRTKERRRRKKKGEAMDRGQRERRVCSGGDAYAIPSCCTYNERRCHILIF